MKTIFDNFNRGGNPIDLTLAEKYTASESVRMKNPRRLQSELQSYRTCEKKKVCLLTNITIVSFYIEKSPKMVSLSVI